MAKRSTKRTAPKARDNETREAEDRETQYRPPSNLPDPEPQDGYVFRWVRTAMFGEMDNRNVSMRYREGFEPCAVEDHPEMMIMSDVNVNAAFEGNIVIGGLMLCKTSTEAMRKREEYYQSLSQQQAASVDQNFMRQNDPRMPLLETESNTQTTFGVGRMR
tara:strand:+ start:71 stop:553 length:483 start_codon:yes stop_codon:yes gene_type:complete